MFLMLVISRLRIVRTVSAASRMASVVSLNPRRAVDDDEVVLAAQGFEDALDGGRAISSAISGDGGASRTRTRPSG